MPLGLPWRTHAHSNRAQTQTQTETQTETERDRDRETETDTHTHKCTGISSGNAFANAAHTIPSQPVHMH